MKKPIAHNGSNASPASLPNELPLHWKAVQLGQVTREFISGGTPSTKEPKFWDGSIAWTTSAPIAEEDVCLNKAQRFITQTGLQNSASHLVPRGNLLVGTRVGVGKAVENLIDIAISQDLTGVVLDVSKVDTGFVAYQFKTEKTQKFFDGRKRGTTIKGISRFDLESLNLYMPPLAEQRAIAHALRSVQEAKEARQRELTLERERKAALMQYLFTHGTRGEPRKQTEIGEIPESWKIVIIDQVCQSLDHKRIPVKLSNRNRRLGNIPYYGASGQAGWIDDYIFDEPLLLVAEDGENLESRKLPISYSINGKSWVNNHAHVLRVKHINQFFLEYYINSIDVSPYLFGATRPKMNKSQLMNMPVPLPKLSEQMEIATILCTFRNKITTLDREISLLDELFRTMLEELMTGRLSAVPLMKAHIHE